MKIGTPKKFTLTEEHLKLLKRMYIGYDDWTEYGAPEVDPKRPYGNSDVTGDIFEILEWPIPDYVEDDGFSDEDFELAHKIHLEMKTALQILVCCASLEPGEYQTEGSYDQDWSHTS